MTNRRKQPASKISIVISLILHVGIVLAIFLFAAREGILGEHLKTLAVTMIPKEKPPEKIAQKPPEQPQPKAEPVQPKVETPKRTPEAAPAVEKITAPAVASASSTAMAPPAEISSFFDGGKSVETTTDPNVLYKNFIEFTLRSRWTRPEGVIDYGYVAEAEVTIDQEGRLVNSAWKKGSGDVAWDGSVRKVLAETKIIGRPPPRGFPGSVLVRFDVVTTDNASIQ